MVCPYCRHATDVINSRHTSRQSSVWRRRRCVACGAVFSTYEQPDYTKTLIVTSSPETFAPFSRDLLFISIYESCKHRTDALSEASALTDTVLTGLLTNKTSGRLERNTIVKTVHDILQRFDTAAAVHYLAYHPL